MSVKEFWEEAPELFWAYRFSYIEKIKRNREIKNEELWLQGAYFYEAISVALSNAFSKKHSNYAEKPYNLFVEDTNEKTNQSNVEIQLRNRVQQIKKLFGGEKNNGK